MQFNSLFSFKMLLAASVLVVIAGTEVFADGDDRYVPRKRAAVAAPAPVQQVVPAPQPVIMREEPAAVVEEDGSCGCGNVRTSLGLPIYFFSQESSNLPAAGAALDYWCDEIPLNFRVGVEGRHMYVGQSSADYAREWPTKTTRITYMRIPFAVEYMHSLAEGTTGYIGGGPDIVTTANDFSETGVGMHLSSRVHYAFTDHVGVSLEAGYMWASVDGQGGRPVRFDGAFVTPMLAYTF